MAPKAPVDGSEPGVTDEPGRSLPALGERVDGATAYAAFLLRERDDLLTALAQRDEAVAFLQDECAALSVALAQRDEAVASLVSERAALGAALAQRDGAVASLVSERDALALALAQRDKSQGYLEDERAALSAALAQRDEAVASLVSERAALADGLARADDGIAFLRLQLARFSEDPEVARAWWDDQFASCWERNGGPGQSRYFMRALLASLGPSEREFLATGAHRVLDWGCATGDGVGELSRAFPTCSVSGLDVSAVAVERARERFPGHEFTVGGSDGVPGRYDVIVTSNCLEHLTDSLTWLKRLAVACDGLLVVLVPYREWPLMEDHRVSFTPRGFPAAVGGLVRLATRTLKTEPSHWAGSQLLVVYGSERFVAWSSQHAGLSNRFAPGMWRARRYYRASSALRSRLELAALQSAQQHLRLRG